MTTEAFAAKRAVFTALAAYTATGQPLEDVQVSYAWPGTATNLCIYGGGVRFEQRDAVAEAPGVMVSEETLVSVYIRAIESPPGDVADTDQQVETVGAVIGTLLRTNPTLGGAHAVVGIARGQGDYTQTDDETISILTYQIRVITTFSYGGP